MAVGDVQQAQIHEYRDDDTGAIVRRLTSDDSDNVHLYFTSTSFIGDDADRVIFSSDRTGQRAFYMLEIPDERIVQVTDATDAAFSQACLDPGGRLMYFVGRTLKLTDLSALTTEDLYTVPEGSRPALPTCTADGSHVAFAYMEQRSVSTETGVIYSTMAERYYQHPACVIMRVDTRSGETLPAWGEHNWISHVCIHPHRPDLILFCHEGGSHVHQRMWIVDLAEGPPRDAARLFEQHLGESCCHEYFTQQGEVGFQCSVTSEDTAMHFNCFIRPDGTWLRQFLLPGPRPGHIQSNSDNTMVVGDRGHLSDDDPEGDNYMSIMRHINGRAEVTRLCRHDTSWKTQRSHPHSVFSPDDRWALFTSDTGGSCDVYMADVTSL